MNCNSFVSVCVHFHIHLTNSVKLTANGTFAYRYELVFFCYNTTFNIYNILMLNDNVFLDYTQLNESLKNVIITI